MVAVAVTVVAVPPMRVTATPTVRVVAAAVTMSPNRSPRKLLPVAADAALVVAALSSPLGLLP